VLDRPLSRDDVTSVYSGLRPLVAGRASATTDLSREHVVDCPEPGLVLIAGGKLTTYRVMGKDAVDAASQWIGRRVARSRTARLRLVGASGLESTRRQNRDLSLRFGLPVAEVDRLIGRYGSEVTDVLQPTLEHPHLLERIAGSRYLLAEVLFAITHEGALRMEDVIERRLRLDLELGKQDAERAKIIVGHQTTDELV
jgi:glycerol-3-phosphate dehydrogenase